MKNESMISRFFCIISISTTTNLRILNDHFFFDWKKILSRTIGLSLIIQMFILADRGGCNLITDEQWRTLDPLFERCDWKDEFLFQHHFYRQGAGMWVTSWLMKNSSWNNRLYVFLICFINLATAYSFLRLKRKQFRHKRPGDYIFLLSLLQPLILLSLFQRPQYF